jgi:glycerol-3-phosphate cytidylyltransferase-like family protein
MNISSQEDRKNSTIAHKYVQDVIVMEPKGMNEDFKFRYLKEVEDQMIPHGKAMQRFNKIDIVE